MKHHYVPVFYLKRWVGLDGKICEFSRPYRDIVPKRVHPAGTGYINDLYRLPGVEGEGAQKLEQLFFSPVDSWASDALAKMHDGRTSNWNVAERSAWTRFVTSLLFRNPDDVSLLIKRMRVDYYITDEKAEARYRVTKREQDPPTLADFLRINASQDYVDRSSLQVIANLIDMEDTGTYINNMKWSVLDIAGGHQLLTSDRPVVMTNGIDKHDSFIMLPIGIHKVFVAATSWKTIDRISESSEVLAEALNRTTVIFASRYVWARNDCALAFVRKNMSKRRMKSVIEMITERKNAFRRAYERQQNA